MFDQILIKSRLHLITGLPAKIQIYVTAKIQMKLSTIIVLYNVAVLVIALEGFIQNMEG